MVSNNSAKKRNSAKVKKKPCGASEKTSASAVVSTENVPTGKPAAVQQANLAPESEKSKVEASPISSVKQIKKAIDEKVELELSESCSSHKTVSQKSPDTGAEKPLSIKVTGSTDKADKTDKTDKTDKADKADKADKSDKSDSGEAASTVQTDSKKVAISNGHVEKANGGESCTKKSGVVTAFEWSATNAKEVILTGSFNDWKKDMVMTEENGKFALEVTLETGKHFYKFIADGSWCFDIRKPNEADSSGNVNNVIIVE